MDDEEMEVGGSYEFLDMQEHQDLMDRVAKVRYAKEMKMRRLDISAVDWKRITTDEIRRRLADFAEKAPKKLVTNKDDPWGTNILRWADLDIVLEPRSEWKKFGSKAVKASVDAGVPYVPVKRVKKAKYHGREANFNKDLQAYQWRRHPDTSPVPMRHDDPRAESSVGQEPPLHQGDRQEAVVSQRHRGHDRGARDTSAPRRGSPRPSRVTERRRRLSWRYSALNNSFLPEAHLDEQVADEIVKSIFERLAAPFSIEEVEDQETGRPRDVLYHGPDGETSPERSAWS